MRTEAEQAGATGQDSRSTPRSLVDALRRRWGLIPALCGVLVITAAAGIDVLRGQLTAHLVDADRAHTVVAAWLSEPSLGPLAVARANATSVEVTPRPGAPSVTLRGLTLQLADGTVNELGDVVFSFRPGPDGEFAIDLPARFHTSDGTYSFGPGSRATLRMRGHVPIAATVSLRHARFEPSGWFTGASTGIGHLDLDWAAEGGELDGRKIVVTATLPSHGSEVAGLGRAAGAVTLAATGVPVRVLRGLAAGLPGGAAEPSDLPPGVPSFRTASVSVAQDSLALGEVDDVVRSGGRANGQVTLTAVKDGSYNLRTQFDLSVLAFEIGVFALAAERVTIAHTALGMPASLFDLGDVGLSLQGRLRIDRLFDAKRASVQVATRNSSVGLFGERVTLGRTTWQIETTHEPPGRGASFKMEIADLSVPTDLFETLSPIWPSVSPEFSDAAIGLVPNRITARVSAASLDFNRLWSALGMPDVPALGIQGAVGTFGSGMQVRLDAAEIAARDLTATVAGEVRTLPTGPGFAGVAQMTLTQQPDTLIEIWDGLGVRAAQEGPNGWRMSAELPGDGRLLVNEQSVSVPQAWLEPVAFLAAQFGE